MDTNELIAQCSAKIAEHELALKTAEKYSNAHAYHHGQITKYSKARQFLKDAAEAETRYAETAAEDPKKVTE